MGAGRKTSIPLGDEPKAVNLRIGQDVLDLLAARWPDLNESECIRAACWEAAGRPQV